MEKHLKKRKESTPLNMPAMLENSEAATELEKVSFHSSPKEGYHRLNRHELAQTLGDGEGQGSLVCYTSWGCRA